MKINWGGGIVIGMGLFIAFIMYFVVRMNTDDRLNHDLVTEEYYKQEMVLQQEIDAETNSVNLIENIKGQKTDAGWLLRFPEKFDPKKIKGTVFLYRPSNKHLDFTLPIILSAPELLIPDSSLVDGRWNITINWEYEGKKFLYKQPITY